MNNCIFCKIEERESDKILKEGKHFYVIPPKKMAALGHTLIVAKRHLLKLEELNKEEKAELLELAARIGNALEKLFSRGHIIWSNYGDAMTINHMHFHLIPVVKGTAFDAWFQKQRRLERILYDSKPALEAAARLKANL